ncbi:MAG: hypothetical protein ACYTFY_20135, partial [Planctomycetota bacterium]
MDEYFFTLYHLPLKRESAMKKLLSIILAITFTFITGCSSPSPQPELTAKFTKTAVTIDGELNEKCWGNAQWVPHDNIIG